jgi:amino acid transporter
MRAIRKFPLICIPLLGGILFVGMGIRLPIGFHMSWNFTQAAIFSGTVSGVEMPPGVWKAVIEGPERMTGGKFGVEASIVAFLLCTTAGEVLILMAARQLRAGSRCAWQQSRPNTARAAVQALPVL